MLRCRSRWVGGARQQAAHAWVVGAAVQCCAGLCLCRCAAAGASKRAVRLSAVLCRSQPCSRSCLCQRQFTVNINYTCSLVLCRSQPWSRSCLCLLAVYVSLVLTSSSLITIFNLVLHRSQPWSRSCWCRCCPKTRTMREGWCWRCADRLC